MTITTTEINGQSLLSTDKVSELLPNVRGEAAMLATRTKWKNVYDRLEKLLRVATLAYGTNSAITKQVVATKKDAIKAVEKEMLNQRQWAMAVYKELRALAPVYTGNLRDSIRFMGSGYGYFNVGIDPEVIAHSEPRKNIRKTARVKRGKRTITPPGYDYSDMANAIAVTSNRGAGGPFKYSTWLEAKRRLAKRYGMLYYKDPIFDEEHELDED